MNAHLQMSGKSTVKTRFPSTHVRKQTPGLRSIHMKQVIPSLELLWTPVTLAASFTKALRKIIRMNLTCCTCK
ncbi:hypothetical protein M9458_012563, partial [Cirrhinus mrigala]